MEGDATRVALHAAACAAPSLPWPDVLMMTALMTRLRTRVEDRMRARSML